MKSIKLLQYDNGNKGSIISTFSSIGFPISLVLEKDDILQADLLILPGVGSAVSAISKLHELDYWKALNDRHFLGKPILGICLGSQLFFSYLVESDCVGLNWLEGKVKRFEEPFSFNNGWSTLNFEQLKDLNLSKNLKKASSFYFNHQYFLPDNNNINLVKTNIEPFIPAIVIQDHLIGVQFHPEKSQQEGKVLLTNILKEYYGF